MIETLKNLEGTRKLIAGFVLLLVCVGVLFIPGVEPEKYRTFMEGVKAIAIALGLANGAEWIGKGLRR